MSPNKTQIVSLITQSGEKLFHGSSAEDISGYYSNLTLRPEEFPIIVGVFNNLQDFHDWKAGRIVKCKLTILYHFPGTGGLELLAEATNLSYIGVRAFALAA